MRLFAFAPILLLSIPSFAAEITAFSCQTTETFQESGIHKFSFRLKNVDRGRLDFENADTEDLESDPLVHVIRPKRSSISHLNENTGISRVGNDIQIEGDADGCELVELRLYRDSGFTRGYFRAKDRGCSNHGDGYVTVRCTVKQLR